MHLTRLFRLVIQDSFAEIAAIIINAALLILVYNLRPEAVVVLYPAALTIAVIAVYIFIKMLKTARFFKRLDESEISVSDDAVEGRTQAKVIEVIGNIHSRHLSEIYRLRAQIETRNALFSQFIHGMKSSVAVIELAGGKLYDATNEALTDIKNENTKLKNSLEQVLNLLRLDAFVNDYVPEKVVLAELVQHTINEHKRDFIYADVYPKLSGQGKAYTDPKWFGFLLGQIISNAVKYSMSGDSVVFEIKQLANNVQLIVQDTGIGIPAEDLPRVYDIFFTGVNGRKRKESTGIGLFMARQIANKLGIEINIESEAGCGTTVMLTFI